MFPPWSAQGVIPSLLHQYAHKDPRNQQQIRDAQANAPLRIILSFKDEKSADVVRRQLSDLRKRINSDLRPVVTCKKIADDIRIAETKPPLTIQQCVVYEFKCHLRDADYVGHTHRDLFLTHWWTQALGYRKTSACRPQLEEQRYSGTVYHP